MELPDKSQNHQTNRTSELNRSHSWLRLWLIAAFAIAFASFASYAVFFSLGLQDFPVTRTLYKAREDSPRVLALGSSLMNFGIALPKVSSELNFTIFVRGCGAGSPAEFEFLAPEVPTVDGTLLFTSIFEMSEGMVSDSHTTLVPFHVSGNDILQTGVSWGYTKTVMWSYPLQKFQSLFPTLGRSWEIFVTIRDKLRSIRSRASNHSEDARIALTPGLNQIQESNTKWDIGRLKRNMAQLRMQNVQFNERFRGPKSLALHRIFSAANNRRFQVLVIMPVSPAYTAGILNRAASNDFASMLDRIQNANPELHVLRLDKDPALQSDLNFWDLVHLNASGQAMATTRLIAYLQQLSTEK